MQKITLCGLALAALLLSGPIHAQQKPERQFGLPLDNPCGTTQYEAYLQKLNPFRPTEAAFETWLAKKIGALNTAQTQKNTPYPQVFTIPVIVHIIHNGSPIGVNENISDAQVTSQITVLNQDFRRMLNTNGHNINPAGADTQIEFCLAKQDTSGLYTSGIERYYITNYYPSIADLEYVKTLTQWDPEKYLNIWVFPSISAAAGYAQFPTNSGLDGLNLDTPATANTDGIAIASYYFGSQEIYPEGYYTGATTVLGRTATHEIGHFFGLRHIWGDLLDCMGTDYCDDTPMAAAPNYNCPTGTDSCPVSGIDMVENYMDYTNDLCQNVFTANQKMRMIAVLANAPRRHNLMTSNTCVPGSIYNNDVGLQIIQPRYFGTECNVKFKRQFTIKNRGSNVLTTAVISYGLDGEEVLYTWAGNLAYGQEQLITLGEILIWPGNHNFNVHVVSANGAVDAAPSNDDKTIVLNVAEGTITQEVIINIMTDSNSTETNFRFLHAGVQLAGNVNYYNPANNSILASNTLYTIPVDIENSGCYTFDIYDYSETSTHQGYYSVTTQSGQIIIEGDIIGVQEKSFMLYSGIVSADVYQTNNTITLYPNPANGTITISVNGTAMLPDSYAIFNTLGQQVGSGKCTTAQQQIDVSGYATGVYFIKVALVNATTTLPFIKN
jgi:hypothetical protein